ncbi:GGDEF domain-containing protein [Pseudarthrobacter sp. P1]|uniref:GGDEF domain-containing protein n=1 Tax=Pseudarthrobacter sp. P1 TaxID=3418418 RepID=UPI003CEC073E
MLDLATMRIVFAILTFAMLVLFYLDTYRRTSAPYCAWWCGTVAAFNLNALLQLVASTGGQGWARHLGNGILVLGAAFIWAGSRSLAGRQVGWRHWAPAPVLAGVAALATTNDGPTSTESVIIALVGAGFGLGAVELLRVWSDSRVGSRPLAVASAACAVYFLVRAPVQAILGPEALVAVTVFGPGVGTLLSMLMLIVVTSSMASLSSEQHLQLLKAQAAQDGLTGLLTRTEFLKQAQVQLHAAAEAGTPATLVMADLDHFKSINDTLGHGAGDQVITAFADACRGSVRSTDLIGRYGGEEFMLLVRGVDAEGATRIADGINQGLAASPALAAMAVAPTASFGIVSTSDAKEPVESLVRRADVALYRAKAAGRNRAVVATW